jgi:hypothetical protein
MNPGDSPLIGAAVQLFVQPNSTTSVTVYTDSTGYFSYCGPFNGTSNIILAQVSPTWLTYNGYAVPSSYITLQGFNSPQLQPGMLPINCGGTNTCSDLWTTVTPWIGYYQNNTAYIKINWGSYGPSAAGTYTLNTTTNSVTANDADGLMTAAVGVVTALDAVGDRVIGTGALLATGTGAAFAVTAPVVLSILPTVAAASACKMRVYVSYIAPQP